MAAKRLYTQLNKPTNQNSLKFPKVVKITNKENVIIKLWGVINSPLRYKCLMFYIIPLY